MRYYVFETESHQLNFQSDLVRLEAFRRHPRQNEVVIKYNDNTLSGILKQTYEFNRELGQLFDASLNGDEIGQIVGASFNYIIIDTPKGVRVNYCSLADSSKISLPASDSLECSNWHAFNDMK